MENQNNKAPWYEITKHLATISRKDDGCSLELNMIRWHGRSERFDIRWWSRTPGGERIMLKGMSFNSAEFEAMRMIFRGDYFSENKEKEVADSCS